MLFVINKIYNYHCLWERAHFGTCFFFSKKNKKNMLLHVFSFFLRFIPISWRQQYIKRMKFNRIFGKIQHYTHNPLKHKKAGGLYPTTWHFSKSFQWRRTAKQLHKSHATVNSLIDFLPLSCMRLNGKATVGLFLFFYYYEQRS